MAAQLCVGWPKDPNHAVNRCMMSFIDVHRIPGGFLETTVGHVRVMHGYVSMTDKALLRKLRVVRNKLGKTAEDQCAVIWGVSHVSIDYAQYLSGYVAPPRPPPSNPAVFRPLPGACVFE